MKYAAALTCLALTLATPAFGGQVKDGFVFVAGGDLIGPYRPFTLDISPGFTRVAELFQRGDVGFANNEGSIFDLSRFPGSPAAENGGGFPVGAAPVAGGLKAMGINMVSKANNHGTDWGQDGMTETLASLAAAGIVQAGGGYSLAEARAPGYLDTKHGRVGLVSTASTFPPMSMAGDSLEYRGVTSHPRPGISMLRVRMISRVSAADFASVRKAAAGMAYPTPGRDDEARIGDVIFRKSDTPGMTWEMEPGDQAAVLASVQEARAKADFVMFTIHAHQTAGDEDPGPSPYQPESLHWANEAAAPLDTRPADFEPKLFHAAIDAGADAVVRTGPHVLNGIEVYKGKPIFYGLASVFYPFGTRRNYVTPGGEKLVMPDECFESVIPVTTYKNGKAEVRLYPIIIEDKAGDLLGFPLMADAVKGRKILERLKTLSAAFGTVVRIENGVGVIALN